MPNLELDWPALRRIAMVLGGSLVLAMILALAGFQYQKSMVRQIDKARKEAQIIRQKANQAWTDKELIEQHLPRFQELMAQKIAGEETPSHRLDWRDAVNLAAEQARMLSLRFSLAPRVVHAPLLPKTKQELEIYASPMDLECGLLHEGDLLTFFQNLEQQNKGLFTVSACQLTRTGQSRTLDIKTPLVTAKCRVQWLTLAKPKEDQP